MAHALGAILGVLGLFLITYLVVTFTRITSREKLHCPRDEMVRDVEFKRHLTATWLPGRKLDVVSCSAFADPKCVTCSKDCL